MKTPEEPDLKLFGLAIWVDGWESQNSHEEYGSELLNVRARMEATGSTVQCGGSILMASDFQSFRDQLASMSARLEGQATLAGFEPVLKVTLKMLELGHVAGVVEITPDYVQSHRFPLNLDQSYLPGIIASCDAIIDRYPVRRRN